MPSSEQSPRRKTLRPHSKKERTVSACARSGTYRSVANLVAGRERCAVRDAAFSPARDRANRAPKRRLEPETKTVRRREGLK